MKIVIALIVFIAISFPVIFLAIKGKIKTGLAIVLLSFSIISGYAIANYDVIKLLRWGDIEIQTFEEDINSIKQSAIDDIKNQVDEQKQALNILIRDLNALSDKLENQNNKLVSLIATAEELQGKTEEQKKDIMTLNKEAEKTKDEIKNLADASAEIALILVRATYYTIETKNQFGTDKDNIAKQEIFKDLNTILPKVIPDPLERASFIRQLKESLYPKN